MGEKDTCNLSFVSLNIAALFICLLLIKENILSTGKSCPALQPPVHGSITSLSCGTSFGSQASLSCDTGYRMTGSSQRSCQADGTWSGNTTICNGKQHYITFVLLRLGATFLWVLKDMRLNYTFYITLLSD